MPGPYEAVLFDFDGVLVDSEPIHWASWAEVIKHLGIQLDWETYRKYCIGVHDRPMLEFVCGLVSPAVDFEEVWKLFPRKRKLFVRRMLRELPFAPRTLEFLRSLEGYRLGLVTSTGRSEVEPLLDAAGILPLFGAAIYAEDVERHKPAPDPYRKAAEMLGVTRALVVEDSEPGLESAKAAGLDVVRVAGPGEMPERVLAALGGP